MKEDIIVPEVKNVVVAAVPRGGDYSEEIWDIHVINLREDDMDNVLVTSQGYGAIDGRDKSTTVLRHFHQQIAAQSSIIVEPIQRELFGIKNEYWISFNSNNQMLDKRFVFDANSITEAALELIPIVGRRGVMIS